MQPRPQSIVIDVLDSGRVYTSAKFPRNGRKISNASETLTIPSGNYEIVASVIDETFRLPNGRADQETEIGRSVAEVTPGSRTEFSFIAK